MQRLEKPIQKHSIRLWKGDADILDEMYPTLGYGKVIRHLVRRHIAEVQERNQRSPMQLTVSDKATIESILASGDTDDR